MIEKLTKIANMFDGIDMVVEASLVDGVMEKVGKRQEDQMYYSKYNPKLLENRDEHFNQEAVRWYMQKIFGIPFAPIYWNVDESKKADNEWGINKESQIRNVNGQQPRIWYHESATRWYLSQIFGKVFSEEEIQKQMINLTTGNALKLDGVAVIKNKQGQLIKVAFEYQGQQHYPEHYELGENDIKYIKQKARDDYKKKWCKKNGILLIEVRYQDVSGKIKNIGSIISIEYRKKVENLGLSMMDNKDIEKLKLEDFAKYYEKKAPEYVKKFVKDLEELIREKSEEFKSQGLDYNYPLRLHHDDREYKTTNEKYRIIDRNGKEIYKDTIMNMKKWRGGSSRDVKIEKLKNRINITNSNWILRDTKEVYNRGDRISRIYEIVDEKFMPIRGTRGIISKINNWLDALEEKGYQDPLFKIIIDKINNLNTKWLLMDTGEVNQMGKLYQIVDENNNVIPYGRGYMKSTLSVLNKRLDIVEQSGVKQKPLEKYFVVEQKLKNYNKDWHLVDSDISYEQGCKIVYDVVGGKGNKIQGGHGFLTDIDKWIDKIQLEGYNPRNFLYEIVLDKIKNLSYEPLKLIDTGNITVGQHKIYEIRNMNDDGYQRGTLTKLNHWIDNDAKRIIEKRKQRLNV